MYAGLTIESSGTADNTSTQVTGNEAMMMMMTMMMMITDDDDDDYG